MFNTHQLSINIGLPVPSIPIILVTLTSASISTAKLSFFGRFLFQEVSHLEYPTWHVPDIANSMCEAVLLPSLLYYFVTIHYFPSTTPYFLLGIWIYTLST